MKPRFLIDSRVQKSPNFIRHQDLTPIIQREFQAMTNTYGKGRDEAVVERITTRPGAPAGSTARTTSRIETTKEATKSAVHKTLAGSG